MERLNRAIREDNLALEVAKWDDSPWVAWDDHE